MILKRCIIFALILCNVDLFAQHAEYGYWNEICYGSARYDSAEISREQLENTYDYLWWAPGIDADATAWTLDEVEELSVGELRNECAERIEKLETLDFVQDTFWSSLQERRINEYLHLCQLKEYTILAYSNPDTLLYYDLGDSTAVYYRDALIAGGQELIEAWIRLNDNKKGRNGNPQRVQRKFDERYNSSRRMEYARLDIMKFGWWNSVNDHLPSVGVDYRLAEEFERLFIEVDWQCEEP